MDVVGTVSEVGSEVSLVKVGDRVVVDPSLAGVPDGSTDGDGWNDVFHPDDQERAWTAWRWISATARAVRSPSTTTA